MSSEPLIFPKITPIDRPDLSLAEIIRGLQLEQRCIIWEGARETPDEAKSTREETRFTYLALDPKRHLTLRNDLLTIDDNRHPNETVSVERTIEDFNSNPLLPLELELEELSARAHSSRVASKHDTILPPFLGGLMGFLAYDAARYFEHIANSSAHQDYPDYHFSRIDELLIIDNTLDTRTLISWPSASGIDNNGHEKRVEELYRLAHTHTKLRTDSNNVEPSKTDSPDTGQEIRFSEKQFVQIVETAKDYIAAGDIFQVVLANNIHCETSINPLDFYLELKKINPSPYHFYFPFSSGTLVGASPERMLQAQRAADSSETELKMRLVAGTYRRGETAEAEALAQEMLLQDEKERAEHIMLVDHCRNDLGRVAKTGSVQVSDLFSVEPYVDVYHLVSQVSCILRPEVSPLTALKHCFPIATLTGTPKIRAMEIIAELETASRGLFGGAVVMLGHDNYLDAGVVIRSAVIGKTSVDISAGAGIVYDSAPGREFRECLWKAKAMLTALAKRTDRS